MGKAWGDYMAKSGKQEYEIGDPMKIIDQLRAELAAAKGEGDRAGFNLADAKGEIAVLSRKLEDCQAACASHETANKHYYEKLEKALAEGCALAADNERLRNALELGECYMKVFRHEIARNNATFEGSEDQAEVDGDLAKVQSALAATPAQSLAAHDAALLRRLAARSEPGERADIAPWLLDIADRIERGEK